VGAVAPAALDMVAVGASNAGASNAVRVAVVLGLTLGLDTRARKGRGVYVPGGSGNWEFLVLSEF